MSNVTGDLYGPYLKYRRPMLQLNLKSETIKCSDCGAFVDFAALSDHECRPLVIQQPKSAATPPLSSPYMPFFERFQKLRSPTEAPPPPDAGPLKVALSFPPRKDSLTASSSFSSSCSSALDHSGEESATSNEDDASEKGDRATVCLPQGSYLYGDASSAGIAGLDSCLEDLRQLTEQDDFDEGDSQSEFLSKLILSSYSDTKPQTPYQGGSLTRTSSLASSRLGYLDEEDEPDECTACHRDLSCAAARPHVTDNNQRFCHACYADRYLPKCRKCRLPIESHAVASSDGKVLGKYHPSCFSCFTCSAPFPNREFYVFDEKPYCQLHYHALNGTLCAQVRCGKPIEGPCVSLADVAGGRYHAQCFVCSHPVCQKPLLDHHFVLNGMPLCESHAMKRHPGSNQSLNNIRKRRTVITKRF